jgi:Protein of unknown function (DUF2802)
VDIELVWQGARAISLVAAFCGFAWALIRMRREHAEQSDRVQDSQRVLLAQLHTLSERTSALATLMASMPRPAVPEAPAATQRRPRHEISPVRSYDTARRLARSGASVEEIVAASGLATSEAHLLRRLQGAATGGGGAIGHG